MKSYDEMLENVYKNLPEKAKEKSRFKVPEFSAFVQGKDTIVTNFVEVCEELRREPVQLMKFLNKETGAQANLDGKRLILKGKIRDKLLNERLNKYMREYVLCKECGKPDTSLVSIDGQWFLRCEACGARSPISVIK